MFCFNGVKSSCQITLPRNSGHEEQADVTSNKWQKNKTDTKVDEHKVYLSKNFVFATCQKSLVIHHCKIKVPEDSLALLDFDCLSSLKKQKEVVLNYSSSTITCLGYDENSSTLCTCSDEIIHLVRWDSLLSTWEHFPISEGEGRILSCCISVADNTAFITLFKMDNVVVYSVKALHKLVQAGPLLLEKIECISVLEKVKDPTSFSKSFLEQNLLRIISVSSGNSASVMLWELPLEKESQIKLVHHQTVGHTKTGASYDAQCKDGKWFVIVMNPEGYGEIFLIQPLGFVLINRIKLEGTNESSTCLDGTLGQAEFRILGTKFFFPNMEEFLGEAKPKDETDSKNLSAGDASFLSDLDNSFGEPSLIRRHKLLLCPKLIVAVATSRSITFIDAKNGEVELVVKYEDLLHEQGIFVQNIRMAVDNNNILVALQPCLTRLVFHRSFDVKLQEIPVDKVQSEISLVPQQILNPKSVLRKKIKSPPRENIGSGKGHRCSRRLSGPRSKYLPVKPPWARSRSRTTGDRKPVTGPLMSARTPTSSQSSFSFLDDPPPSSRPVKIPCSGSYKDVTLNFSEDNRIHLDTALSEGMSSMRLSFHHNGKVLAAGGSCSPLIITKTQPFETIRRLKDVSKITSLGFSFNSDYLVMAASDRRTTVINWRTSKELLSFDFTSKFNEHLHAQFYFMDKFILQPEENKIVLYSYARRETGYIKLQAGSFSLQCQSITAVAAPNQFYSNQVICGLSNKNIAVFDTNVEKVALTIPQTHGKTISCIRLNEAPKGTTPTELCDVFLTSSVSSFDPIKLWDLRTGRCIFRVSDTNPTYLVPSTRPALSPCGRYIASGFEDNTLILYDIRNVSSRCMSFKGLKSSVLDCAFDTNTPLIWCGCRNGTFWNFYTK